MAFSRLTAKTALATMVALLATSAIAEDMSLPGPSGDCLSRATAQLSLDTAMCAGRYPVAAELYGECITRAHLAYVAALNFCQNVSGAKLGALRVNETRNGKLGKPHRL